MQEDAVAAGQKVLLIDDLLATGGIFLKPSEFYAVSAKLSPAEDTVDFAFFF